LGVGKGIAPGRKKLFAGEEKSKFQRRGLWEKESLKKDRKK